MEDGRLRILARRLRQAVTASASSDSTVMIAMGALAPLIRPRSATPVASTKTQAATPQ